jgi:hypothetical protein
MNGVAVEFLKECGPYNTGAALALKTAQEIDGYHLAKGYPTYENVACSRATAMRLMDDPEWTIMRAPQAVPA